MSDQEDFHNHLSELRTRLKYVALSFAAFFALGFWISGDLISLMQYDLGITLHGLTPYEVVHARIIAGVLISLMFTFPIGFHQFIKFARPGLTKKEYKALRNVIPLSVMLFALGAVFSYELVFKNALVFFEAYTFGSDVEVVWGLMNTVVFGLQLSFLTGFMFQIPVVTIVLAKLDLITSQTMKDYRNHVIVGVLLIAAVATPPDLITQVLVTVPVIGLYQLSIYTASYVQR